MNALNIRSAKAALQSTEKGIEIEARSLKWRQKYDELEPKWPKLIAALQKNDNWCGSVRRSESLQRFIGTTRRHVFEKSKCSDESVDEFVERKRSLWRFKTEDYKLSIAEECKENIPLEEARKSKSTWFRLRQRWIFLPAAGKNVALHITLTREGETLDDAEHSKTIVEVETEWVALFLKQSERQLSAVFDCLLNCLRVVDKIFCSN